VGGGTPDRTMKSRGSNRSRRTGKSTKSLSIQLNKERKHRRKLEQEVNDVKAQLAQLKGMV